MNHNDFLNAIIDDGIMEITTTYTKPDQQTKKSGGIKGFEICRGKTSDEILAELDLARRCVEKARTENNTDWYWHWVMYERQIEWVLNVLSAVLYEQGKPVLIQPTVRGMIKAANILGVESP